MKKKLIYLVIILFLIFLNCNTPEERLMNAIDNNNFSEIDEILKSNTQIDVNAKSKHGETALTYAVLKSNFEIVKHLIVENGADVNAKNKNGKTALMYASNNNLTLVKQLIEKGADVNAKDNNGKTALMYAGNVAIMEYLINRGADVNAKDKKSETALTYAMVNRDLEIVKYLREKGGYSYLRESLYTFNKWSAYYDFSISLITLITIDECYKELNCSCNYEILQCKKESALSKIFAKDKIGVSCRFEDKTRDILIKWIYQRYEEKSYYEEYYSPVGPDYKLYREHKFSVPIEENIKLGFMKDHFCIRYDMKE